MKHPFPHRLVVELFSRCFGQGSAAKKQINRVHHCRVERHEPSLAFGVDQHSNVPVAGAFGSHCVDEKFGQTVKVAHANPLKQEDYLIITRVLSAKYFERFKLNRFRTAFVAYPTLALPFTFANLVSVARELIFCVAALALFGSIVNTLPAPANFNAASYSGERR